MRPWAEAAAIAALGGRKPRTQGVAAAMEIEQLCLAINRAGLILVVDADAAEARAGALVHALEWISRMLTLLWWRCLRAPGQRAAIRSNPAWRGMHHRGARPGRSGTARTVGLRAPVARPGAGYPASLERDRAATGQGVGPRSRARSPVRLQPMRSNDPRQPAQGRPDMEAGRLVVELDGYADHATRAAFMHDRHRDYELTLAGYTVLRLANDEIAQDIEKAIEKIRDIVQLCRARNDAEGVMAKRGRSSAEWNDQGLRRKAVSNGRPRSRRSRCGRCSATAAPGSAAR